MKKLSYFLVLASLLGAGCNEVRKASCDYEKGELFDFRTEKCVKRSQISLDEIRFLEGDEQLVRAMNAGYSRAEVAVHFAGNEEGYFDTSVQRMLELLKDDQDAKISIVGYYLPTMENMRIPVHYPGAYTQELRLKDIETIGYDGLRIQLEGMSDWFDSYKEFPEAVKSKKILVEAVYGGFDLKNLQKIFRANSREFAGLRLADSEFFLELYAPELK